MSIEAQSLASISHLATNPPSNCDDPSKSALSSLTLYIVRVPGSRDVFLTPLKPRDRVVNAQDVQSSLYFLHVDSEEDILVEDTPVPEPVATPITFEDPSYSISRKPINTSVARKPLPTPPASPGHGPDEMDPWMSRDLSAVAVPSRKPLIPRRNPNRESSYRPSSIALFEMENSSITSSLSPASQTLTLIRRDPTSGDQWNVAKISDPPVDEVSSEALKENRGFSKKMKNSGAPLFIDIDNTGYSQFVKPSLPPRSTTDHGAASPNRSPPPRDRVFKRRLWMDGSRFANHTYTSRRPLSTASFESDNSTYPNPSIASSRQLFSPVSIDKRSRGYAFEDAWGHKCEFSTATTGSSLRCRQVRNAAVMSEDMGYVEVSELRFNLPSHHFSSKSESSISNDARAKRNSYFSTTGTSDVSSLRSGHTRSSISEDGTVDYSLGRERAGGGFGGRETKLGKLIVEEMGQKMLDLVVATNMALWWRAYEKCS
ncbi:hypothetical protein BDZ85DRAFT_315398 [Elsinoe ampelina]|uniref:Uncharacterized protein n=1 Tax=Elsinoe ampelina TaxID=302913 RepID=A0A6A6GQL2_9PEZI|nr:hypothetical protein BDZ85DRAFT_315398 [Elsinoe ampelina]